MSKFASIIYGVDEGASLELIRKQLGQIADQINANPIKIKFGVDANSVASVKTAIQSALATASTFSLGTDRGKTNETISQIKAIAAEMKNVQGLDVAKWSVFASTDGEDMRASIQYYKRGTQELITDTYSFVKASEDAAAELKHVGTTASDNLKKVSDAAAQAAKTAAKAEEATAQKFVDKVIKEEEAAIKATVKTYDAAEQAKVAAAQKAKDAAAKKAQEAAQAEIDAINRVAKAHLIASLKKQDDAIRAQEASKKASLNEAATAQKSGLVELQRREAAINRLTTAEKQLAIWGRTWSQMKSNPTIYGEYVRLTQQLQLMKSSGTATVQEMRDLAIRVSQFGASCRVAGVNAMSLGDKFKQSFSKFSVWLSASAILMSIIAQVRNVIRAVTELDKHIVDLQIATGKTRAETQALVSGYAELGRNLGATTVEVASAADTFLRQGKTLTETNTLLTNSIMLSKLGQIEAEEASKALTSAMKGYNVTVEDSIGIVDRFTAVDMVAAVSAGDIATAMAETAVSADIVGVSMDRLTGYIARVSEVTQDGAELIPTQVRQAA